jgi:DNA repair protein RadA/Sms
MKVLEVADMSDALRVLPRSRRREDRQESEDRR